MHIKFNLLNNWSRVIGEIQPEWLRRVCENWTSRLRPVRAARVGHMPEIIFKY